MQILCSVIRQDKLLSLAATDKREKLLTKVYDELALGILLSHFLDAEMWNKNCDRPRENQQKGDDTGTLF